MRRNQQDGFTLIELLMVVAIIGIIAAIAIPGLLRSRQSANEASAIGSMRSISSAQSAYAASCGSGYYARSLEVLAAPPTTGGGAFVGADLATTGVVKSAYTVTMVSDAVAPAVIVACNAGALGTGYHATAIPLPGGGARAFGTNTSGTIYYTVVPLAITISDTAVASGTALK
jgi:prepilin-type N-terminal cleavage/methylation domain-containing protein